MPDDTDVASTWTDELNRALHPLGILLAGADAASILPLKKGPLLQQLLSLTEQEIVQIATRANRDFETDKIEAEHIRTAIEGVKWNWQDE